jgi:hypothetical protein
MLSVAQLAQAVTHGQAVALPVAPKPSPLNATAEPSKKNFPAAANGVKETSPSPATGPNPADFGSVWEQVLQELGQIQRAQLQAAGIPAILGPNSLVIAFPADYSGAYDACASDAGQESIRRALRKVSGKDWLIRLELKAAPAGLNGAAEPARPAPKERPKDLLELPMFKRAIEVLGAQLVKVDDGFDPTPEPRPAAPRPSADEPDPDEV